MQTRWVSWAAVSSLPQAKKVSNEDQLATNRTHVERHGGTLIAELVVPGESRSIILFEDAARKIDAYAQLKRLIDAKAFDVLVYLDRSRLGRKASLSMAIVELCHDAGIITYETDNPPASLSTHTTHDDALIGAIKSVGAQQEIDKLKRRHEMGMIGRIRAGQFPNRPPFGYSSRYDVDGSRHVLIDDESAETVRRIFSLYLDGNGTPAIVELLNAEGRRSATGKPWGITSINRVLDNVWVYSGSVQVNLRSNREYVRTSGRHPAIISADVAEMVTQERAARVLNRRMPNTKYLLSGVVICAECGQTMHCVRKTTEYKGKLYEHLGLRCPRHERERHCTYRHAMTQLRAAIAALNELGIDDLIDADAGLADMLLGQIAEQEAQTERLQAALQRADDAFVSGIMDAERYSRQIDRLNASIAACGAEIERLRTRYDDEADADKRTARIQDVAAHGLAMLDGDATTGNAWLRRHVRMYCQDNAIVGVEWL